jgi:hypothetical protein
MYFYARHMVYPTFTRANNQNLYGFSSKMQFYPFHQWNMHIVYYPTSTFADKLPVF